MAGVRVLDDSEAVARAAADLLIEESRVALERSGRFALAMSGGSTPLPLLRLLATKELMPWIDWGRVHLFWSDERCVPEDSEESNYGRAKEALLRHVPIPERQVYPMRCDSDPESGAAEYDRRLRAFFEGASRPTFDAVLLGLGHEAHTASLFPFGSALSEPYRWAVAQRVAKFSGTPLEWRMTLTPAAINAGTLVVFLVTGKDKAQAVRDVLEGPFHPDQLPAQIVRPQSGRLIWLIDAAAASMLESSSRQAKH